MQGVIQLLPDDLASQVAAGEVVERPANVVKELVENSIDAGATSIEVSIQQGGLRLIRVQDNGCGMNSLDAEACLQRHATSKLKNSADLETILTMGFRGEAIPSIASISQFRLVTKTSSEIEATEVSVQGGAAPQIKSTSSANGTSIEVKELFYNIPARRKFLKSERTEAAHIEHQLRVHALAQPQIRWIFRKDQKLVFDIPASSDIRARLASIHGKEVAENVVSIEEYKLLDYEVHGYMASLDHVRKSRKHQYFFINGRPVEDSALSRGVRDLFLEKLEHNQHPMVWLWITMPPHLVDVNVHPAKREIRLLRPLEVRNLIAQAIDKSWRLENQSGAGDEGVSLPAYQRNSLGLTQHQGVNLNKGEGTESTSELHTQRPQVSKAAFKISSHVFDQSSSPQQTDLALTPSEGSLDQKGDEAKGSNAVEENASAPGLRLIDTLKKQYYLAENPEGMVVIDPKKAWERIIYDQILGVVERPDSQKLLVPVMIELDPREVDFILNQQEAFETAGIGVELFGSNAINVTEVPQFFDKESPRFLLTTMIDELIEQNSGLINRSARAKKPLTLESLAKTLSKKASQGKQAEPYAFSSLLAALFKSPLPYCAPGGEPTMFQLCLNELKNRFKS